MEEGRGRAERSWGSLARSVNDSVMAFLGSYARDTCDMYSDMGVRQRVEIEIEIEIQYVLDVGWVIIIREQASSEGYVFSRYL